MRYNITPLGWAICRCVRRWWPGCLRTRLNGLRLVEVEPPALCGDDWVRVRTLLGGICGSDVATLAQKHPPDSLLQAFTTLPFLLGHENVAVVEEVGPAVDKAWLGRRVCVEPTLGCAPRGIDPPCDRCRAGQFCACENFGAAGVGAAGLPAGTSIGYNPRTGGSHGEHFVAHVSRLVAVSDALSDEQAVLTDPLACGLHAVLRADLDGAERVCVYGSGMLGLAVVGALRAVGYAGRIDVIERAGYLRPLADAAGADTFVILPREARLRHERIAETLGCRVHRARFGNFTISGGYDVMFECAGARRSMSEALCWTRSRGQVVLVATGHGRGVDMTPIWFTELRVLGAYGRQVEHHAGRGVTTYALTHELMTSGALPTRGLLTHTFPLRQYKRAFAVAMDKAAHNAVKVAFDFRTS
ncbi:MAG: alcohol dehydrogenase catalytic domain-containing protein [Phycisphaerae bacterium]|nr:alcohol dehydrogenase catalytic domain-containing protein [Phycisphaerae bacterium]